MKPEQAKFLYYKLWALHIDSRALLNGPVSSGEIISTDAAPKTAKKSKMIKPGKFFRLNTDDVKDGIEIVMAMGVEHTSKSKEKDEVGYICAAVRHSGEISEAYELFVANQQVIEARRLNHEVVLEYDSHSRYYFLKDG